MARLEIEVILAWRGGQEIVTVDLEEGATALDAVRKSGLAGRHPGIDIGNPALGIYGRLVKPDTPLREGDRVELYRPLNVDPKEARRAKASGRKRPGRRA